MVDALPDLNQRVESSDLSPLVEVKVVSRNSPDTGIRVLKTIRRDQLAITRSAFTGGESVADYMDAFDVDLLLTNNVDDAQKEIDSRRAAAILKAPPANAPKIPKGQVRIAFDGDTVLFSDASELVYKTQGWMPFRRRKRHCSTPPCKRGPMPACS
nr:5'-nucleotidase [Pseudomonas sp. Choline-02u-1]